MTDWRERFPDESRVSWERKVAEAAGPLWPLARPFIEAWRYDSTLPLARTMEAYFDGVVYAVAVDDAEALEQAAAAVRGLLREAGLDRLRLYRGQPIEPGWSKGAVVVVRHRGLTAWSPDRPVAFGHAGRRRPAVVLATEIEVDQVALAFDPSSDGEIVLLGEVRAVVDSLVP